MMNIDILTDKDHDLMGRAEKLGEETKDRLQEVSKGINFIGDIRGRGLFIGVELVKNKETGEPLSTEIIGEILSGLLNQGIIVVPCGRYHNIIRFMPSLIITKEYLEKATYILLNICKKF